MVQEVVRASGSVNKRCIMYVQYLEYINFDSFDELTENVMNELGNEYQIASIVHDKDIDEVTGKIKDPHIHIVFYDTGRLSLRKLKEATRETKENYFEFMERKDAAFMYLIHAAKKDRNNYQYDISDVTANFDYEDYLKRIRMPSKNKLTINSLLQDVLDSKIRYSDIQNDNDLSVMYAKHKSKIDNALNIASKRRAEQKKNVEVPVIWIYGKESGIGKTTYANQKSQKLEQAYNYSTYMTSANNDPFQDYKGEEIIIIDDIKPNDIDFSDLLRLLDPYNATSVRSRYSNKYVSADVIFVTSMYSPEEFYLESNIDLASEPIDQLLRRISTVCHVTPLSDDDYLAEVGVYKMTHLDEPVVVDDSYSVVKAKNVVIKSNYAPSKDKKKT